MIETRARETRPADLTQAQARILGAIEAYVQTTGEPCGARYLARRLGLHHSSIQDQLARLHRKGWLRTARAPVFPRARGAK